MSDKGTSQRVTTAEILERIAAQLYGKPAAELTAEECREILEKLRRAET